MLGKVSDYEIAQILNRHPSAVRHRRIKLNIQPFIDTSGDVWNDKNKSLIGTMPDMALAKKLGISTTTAKSNALS